MAKKKIGKKNNKSKKQIIPIIQITYFYTP